MSFELPITVTTLSVAPVKGTRLHWVESVELTDDGAVGDRHFFVIDERNRMVNGKQLGELQSVDAWWDGESRRLALDLPGRGHVEDDVADDGELVTARFYSGSKTGRLVEGPFAAALSEHVRQPLRLVEADAGSDGGSAVDRGAAGAVTLISQASLARLAAQGGLDALDPRRFRMLIELDGVDAHAEDAWVGRTMWIGETLIAFEGHVGRCLITSRHPETGAVDVPTLDLLGAYRRDLPTTEPLPFGIYGRVEAGGEVRVGDAVRAAD